MSVKRNKAWETLFPLILVAGLSGLIVSVFYGWINPIIEARREQEVIELGLRMIFPEAERMTSLDVAGAPPEIEMPIYEVFGPQNESLGYMYYVTGQGWETFRLAVGVDPVEKRLVGARVLEHQETPGLGSAITEDWFLGQFSGKALSDPFQAGNDVEAISGATVSTRGVAQTLSQSARALLEAMGIDVEVATASDETSAAGAGGARAAEPQYAAKIRQALGEELSFVPADVWQVKGEDGKPVAWAVRIQEEGYGGPMNVLTLVDPADATVIGVEVLSHNETPGLGDLVTEPFFLGQFYQRSPKDPLEVGADIDGVTMATRSAEAVARAVKRALTAVEAVGGYGGER